MIKGKYQKEKAKGLLKHWAPNSDIIPKVFWLLMSGKMRGEAEGKGCFKCLVWISMLSNLKSALKSDVFGKLKERLKESLKMTLWPARWASTEEQQTFL